MSSGFVSGGTNEQPIERDDEWLRAQQAIDAARREKQERGKQAEGKSLYEVLQANQAAKQEAFEESLKLKHQFQALDDDEVEFLDSIRESERAKDAAVRKETQEQLAAFRKQREVADSATGPDTTDTQDTAGNTSPTQDHQWSVSGKKRRRGPEKELLKGVKLRKASSSEQHASAPPESAQEASQGPAGDGDGDVTAHALTEKPKPKPMPTPDRPLSAEPKRNNAPAPALAPAPAPAKPASGLGLGAYDSDSD